MCVVVRNGVLLECSFAKNYSGNLWLYYLQTHVVCLWSQIWSSIHELQSEMVVPKQATFLYPWEGFGKCMLSH